MLTRPGRGHPFAKEGWQSVPSDSYYLNQCVFHLFQGVCVDSFSFVNDFSTYFSKIRSHYFIDYAIDV